MSVTFCLGLLQSILKMIRVWTFPYFVFFWDLVLGGMLGPSDLMFKNFESCEPPLENLKFWVSQRRHNRTTTLMDILIDTPFDIDDDVLIEIKGSLWGDGGWKPGAYHIQGKTCDTLLMILGETFRDILRATGKEDCPLPAGRHEAIGYYFDNNEFNVPQVFGQYRLELLITRDDTLEMCNIVYLDMVPKNTFGL